MNLNKDLINYITNFGGYGKSAIEYLLNNKDNNDKQILDPLTTIIKIALLFFHDKGAKLSIYNNSIKIQKANSLQGILRWSHGDSRNKLYNLKEPIKNCLIWFPYSKYKNLKTIYSYAIKGLEKLKFSYSVSNSNITSHLIEYYIKIITDNLNEIELKINNVDNIEQSIIIKDTLQKNIKKIWTNTDIILIENFFKILIENFDNNKNIENIYLSLLQFLKEKDEKLKSYIKKYTTELLI